MSLFRKLRFYLGTVSRHARYGSLREALAYAWHHRRFWCGAEDDGKPYVHIGHQGGGK